MKIENKYIGCNFTGSAYLGGIISSFDREFDDEEVLLESGIMDIVPCKIGNISDAYQLLKENIKKNNANSFEEICACIYETVDTYFGGISHIDTRMSYYKDLDDIKTSDDITKISSLKGKGAAMCVERAMLSQNLLQSLGFKSFYKCSGIEKNDKKEIHAYNLVENNGEYYIFDTSIPTIINDKTSPLVAKIPKEVYNEISNPNRTIGYSVKTIHYNPIRNNDVEITYDIGRKNLYIAKHNDKKKK